MADPMRVPPINDPRWRDVATGRLTRPWKMLAVKIMMTRILGLTTVDSSATTVNGCVQEIHSFFVKNAQIAQVDLAAIFN